jgi:hypothetical protein
LTTDLCDVNLETIHTLDYKDLPLGKWVKLTVSDTGCGIEPGDNDRIFDPIKAFSIIGLGIFIGKATRKSKLRT